MSPLSEHLHRLRMRHGLRQADLARRIGYEQSYISALEVGLKGPPTDDFLQRLAEEMSLNEQERGELMEAARQSQRKLTLPLDAPAYVYQLVNNLRDEIPRLTAAEVRAIQGVLELGRSIHGSTPSPARTISPWQKEAPM